MLEGMAPAQARVVRARSGSLLLYTPVVSDDDYVAAIAYLSRRLDENATPENFLRALVLAHARFTGVETRTRPLRHRGCDTARRSRRRTAPDAGPPHRSPHVRSRRAVRERTRHRLHTAGEPRVDRRRVPDRRRVRRCRPLVTNTDGVDAAVERARCRGTSVGHDVDRRSPRRARARRERDGREPRAHARRHGPRNREDRARGRPRGLGGHRHGDAGPPRRPAPSTNSPRDGVQCAPRGRRRRGRAVELPVRDPGQRRRGRARGRERRDPQARARSGGDGAELVRAAATTRVSPPTSCN